MVHDAWPCRSVCACKDAIDDAEEVEHGQVRAKPPENKRAYCSAEAGDHYAGCSVQTVDQSAHDDTTKDAANVEHEQGQRGWELTSSKSGTGISRQKDTRQEEAHSLNDVGGLVEPKRPVEQKAQVKRPDVTRCRRRQTRLDEPNKRERQNEQSRSPDAQRGAEAVPAEKELKNQRNGEAPKPRARPHDAIREAPALDEPLVHVNHTGTVADGATDGVEHALGGDEVRGVLGKGAGGESDAHEEEASGGSVFGGVRVDALEGDDEGDVEIHDALGGGGVSREISLNFDMERRMFIFYLTMAHVPMMAIWEEPAKGS